MLPSNQYPADAIGGGDFLSGAAARRIEDVDASGQPYLRPEIIVVCDKAYDFDDRVHGRVCLSETTIRSLGAVIGLTSAPVVANLEASRNHWRDRAQNAEERLGKLTTAVEAIDIARVYVALDGSEHPTVEAARAHQGSWGMDFDDDDVPVTGDVPPLSDSWRPALLGGVAGSPAEPIPGAGDASFDPPASTPAEHAHNGHASTGPSGGTSPSTLGEGARA